jgi:ribosomal protein S6--L-glutamate ligase
LSGVRVAILGTPGSWHVEQFRSAAARLGLVADVVPLRALSAQIERTGAKLLVAGVNLLEVDRVLVRGIPAGSLEQVVLRMDVLHQLAAAGIKVLNPPRAVEACVDKHLATTRLHAAGLPVPRTAVCEGIEPALEAFHWLGGDVVVKPLFGSEGRGIVRIDNPILAERVFRALMSIQAIVYLQEFVAHPGYDVRALVLGDRVLAAMRRSSSSDFRTNVAQGAAVSPFHLPAEWHEMAVCAARTISAPLAGVDLLPNERGQPLVVEVNSAPGFRALAQTTAVDVPAAILRFLIDADWPQ